MTCGLQPVEDGWSNLRGERLTDTEVRKRCLICIPIIQRTGDDALELHLFHDLRGVRNTPGERLKLRLRQLFAREKQQRTQGSTDLPFCQTKPVLHVADEALARLSHRFAPGDEAATDDAGERRQH